MRNVQVEDLVTIFVRKSCVKPSESFGPIVLEVDHKILGKLAREHRRVHKIKAVRVAEQIRLSKVRLNFLESGNKRWTANTLRQYIAAVESLRQKGKKQGQEGKKQDALP